VGFALEMQRLRPVDANIVILGNQVGPLAQGIADHTGLDVIGIEGKNLIHYHGELYQIILEELLEALGTDYVCIGHTSQGWDYAPGLAVRLRAACITGVEGCHQKDGQICFTRSIHNGKILAHIRPETDRVVLTIQPGTFKGVTSDPEGKGRVDIRVNTTIGQQSRQMGFHRTEEGGAALAEAEIIVAGGRGIGKEENLELIRQLASLFPKSAVGGSRPVCDMGWLEYKRQVGLTGATVTPRLYLACGISGASQHVIGMRGAGFVVAINRDPDAAIFNFSDVCVVADLKRFIPAFIEAFEKWKRGRKKS
jgi:electron transfer flavoprotein alpha subunit